MGVCDSIPGISGGTIAFITGIYERLINAIKGFSPELLLGMLALLTGKGDKKKFREDLKKTDLSFLIPLVLGILIALFLFSRVMSYLLENHFSYIMAFFVGLILASAKTIFSHIEKHHSHNVFLMLIGLALGISLAFLVPTSINPSYVYVLFGGFLAICAMILPGISGAFILLIMGLYQFVLGLIKDFPARVEYLLVFGIGAILGFFTISRAVSWLFKKDKSKTLYFLLGLVVGGLSVPLKGIFSEISLNGFAITIHICLFIIGAVAAHLIEKIAKK